MPTDLLNESTGDHLRNIASRMDTDEMTDDLDSAVVRLACDIASTVLDGGIVEVRYMKDPPLWGWGWREVTTDQAEWMRGETFSVVARVRMFGINAS